MHVLALVFALALQPVMNDGKIFKTASSADKQPTKCLCTAIVKAVPTPITEQSQTEAGQHQENPNGAWYPVEVKKQPPPEDTPLFKWYLLATALGVAVNAFIWYAILQQTKLNKKIADGAEKSANTLIDIQRAWLNAEVWWGVERSTPHTFVGQDGETHTLVDVVLGCTNYGFTPAWIYERHIKLEITNSVAPKPDLRGADVSYQIHPLSKEQEPTIWRLDKMTGKGQTAPGKYAFVYGVVKYRDIFQRERDLVWLHDRQRRL
jgi:hypothetical protein